MIHTTRLQETDRRKTTISSRWIVLGLALACLALLAPRIASGQASAGITGTITDASGAVIPNAEVTITDIATSVADHTISSSAGTYSVKGIPPGRYRVTVEASGFKKVCERRRHN